MQKRQKKKKKKKSLGKKKYTNTPPNQKLKQSQSFVTNVIEKKAKKFKDITLGIIKGTKVRKQKRGN